MEPNSTICNHELDPEHKSGSEEAPSTITPIPAVPSADNFAKEVTKQEVDAKIS